VWSGFACDGRQVRPAELRSDEARQVRTAKTLGAGHVGYIPEHTIPEHQSNRPRPTCVELGTRPIKTLLEVDREWWRGCRLVDAEQIVKPLFSAGHLRNATTVPIVHE
jgi:hypothetical protein